MASQGRESCLELCSASVTLGNGIAVHMLDYLSVVKMAPTGFKELAEEFLETSRVLISSKTGLTDSGAQLSPSEAQELRERLRQSHTALIVLDRIVNRYIDNERKQRGFRKLGSGFRMMFADSEIEKLRQSLSQCREGILKKPYVLQWTLSGVEIDTSANIGYTALAAVLDWADPTRIQGRGAPSWSTVSRASTAPGTPVDLAPISLPPTVDSYAGSVDSGRVMPSRTLSTHMISGCGPSIRPSIVREDSKMSFPATACSSESSCISESKMVTDNLSEVSAATSILDFDEMLASEDQHAKQAGRVTTDPSKVPRFAPKSNTGANSPASKAALLAAVQRKDHRMIEQLLDSGTPTDLGPERNLFSIAIVNHDFTSVRILACFGADPNSKDKNGFTPLLTATQASFFQAAKLLLQYNAQPNMSAGPYDESPFARSLISGQAQFAELYLRHGAQPGAIMGNGNTAFIQAITKTGSVDLIKLMLTHTDPNGKNARGEVALHKAITVERLDIVALLIENGANPNLPGPKHMLWPSIHQPRMLEHLLEHGADLTLAPGILELATSINSQEAVDLLLRYGADPNVKKDGIFTPLCTAIRDDRADLVDVLLAGGADPNLQASEFPAFTCVTHHRAHLLPRLLAANANPNSLKGIVETAIVHNEKECLLILLEHGVDPNVRSPSGHTALTTAISTERTELLDILLAHGADPAVRGQEWPISMAVKAPDTLAKLLPRIALSRIPKGALEQAVVANELESVKLLLAKGVDVEEKNGGVFSPLTTAIREDRKAIFRYLIDEAGADPNAPGEHLPIVKAIRRHRENDLSYIDHLLSKGADINVMYRGWNAVLQAVDNGDRQILKLLAARARPDLNARDEDGRSVREIMEERGLQEEEQILLSGRAPSPALQKSLEQLRGMYDSC